MSRRCRGCGRPLRLPSLDGYGPVCRARMLPAAPSPTRTPTARHTGAHHPAQPDLEDTMPDTTTRDARYSIDGHVADYCTSTDQHTAHEWGGTATPERFHCPGFPARLEAEKVAVADCTKWARQAAADGLQPDEHELTWKAGEQPIVRVHFAFHDRLSPEARDYLVQTLGEALGGELEAAFRAAADR